MSGPSIVVIGMGHDGPEGLSRQALDHLGSARVLAGGRRHLAFFEGWEGETIVIDADLDRLVRQLREVAPGAKAVVLASGDPLFYGVGRSLLEAFPRESLTFLPHLSSVQIAFARVKESWDDATVVSLHGRPLASILPALGGLDAKIAVLTDGTNHPGAIADLLVDLGLGEAYRIWVCEELGGPRERVTSWTPEEARGQTFSPLNVVILRRSEEPATRALPLVGIPEEALRHAPGRRGMITKREVRLIALAYLGLGPRDVLWDVGAGSGSLALEAARLSPRLTAFAIEREPTAHADILENARSLGASGLQAVLAEAPDAFVGLPDPDAVFVGGSGGHLRAIVLEALLRLRPGGRIVLNCVTIENFCLGWGLLNDQGLAPQATSVQIAHSGPVGRLHRLEPENPILILRATKS
jgi:precorrin-6B C5,15-methyltransferase / cobalt-precorrin-6B C5,C15-methyltransferase